MTVGSIPMQGDEETRLADQPRIYRRIRQPEIEPAKLMPQQGFEDVLEA
jgi:hypothetical protein